VSGKDRGLIRMIDVGARGWCALQFPVFRDAELDLDAELLYAVGLAAGSYASMP
jgi:hypothetical protein